VQPSKAYALIVVTPSGMTMRTAVRNVA